MRKPTLLHSRMATQVSLALSQTISIERNANALARPATAPSWSTLHADVAAQVRALTSTEEGRERRRQGYTVAAEGVSIICEGWLSTVKTTDRVLFGGDYYDILAVVQVGDLALTKIIAQRREP